jgi:hypothetical protein
MYEKWKQKSAEDLSKNLEKYPHRLGIRKGESTLLAEARLYDMGLTPYGYFAKRKREIAESMVPHDPRFEDPEYADIEVGRLLNGNFFDDLALAIRLAIGR